LRQFLGLERYQSKTSELERVVVETVSEQTYRRSSDHMRLIGQLPLPRSTAHRWVVQSVCDEPADVEEQLELLMADGTGYKPRPNEALGIDRRSELRVAIGVTAQGEAIGLGAWTERQWPQIAAELQQRSPHQDKPLSRMFLSDGERGLPETFSKLAEFHQRCHWHMVHDLDLRMREAGIGKKERRRQQKRLAAILSIPLQGEDVEVPPDEDELTTSMLDAERKVDELAESLLAKGCARASLYVRRAKDRLFSYLRFWMKTGIVSPRGSGLIERLMRELARRLKRMAFGWSPAGAAKMARIILKRFLNEAQWQAYWKGVLRIQDNVILAFRTIRPI
jgi:hypothetical protein